MRLSLLYHATAALVLIAMGGCVSGYEYVPISEKSFFGYSDRPNADGGHTVRVELLNGPMAIEFWNRRVAEVCDGKVSRKSMHTALLTTTRDAYYHDLPGHYVVEGYVYCETPASPAMQAEPAA